MNNVFGILVLIAVVFLIFKSRSKKKPSSRVNTSNYERIRNPKNTEDQIYLVSSDHVHFEKQRIMNKEEYFLFQRIEKFLSQHSKGFHVFPQVSMGEFLKCQDKPAFASVNSKRVDILVTDPFGFPCAVIEYQGGGHHQNNAVGRDAVKKRPAVKQGLAILK